MTCSVLPIQTPSRMLSERDVGRARLDLRA
jgi:hypothetical protein